VENLETELDRLYGLELGEFVAERDRLARELRGAGRREEAEQVKALRKPSLSAWTINRLAREERRNVDLLLDAGHRLRQAQHELLGGSETGSLDEARQTERRALAELRTAAQRILGEEGRGGDTTLNRVTTTLSVAAVSEEGRELLARGRLTGDLEATGFDLLTPAPQKGRKAPRPAKRAASPERREADRKRLETAERQLDEAREAQKTAAKTLREAEEDAAEARRGLAAAEKRLTTAQRAAEKAGAAVDRAEKRLRDAESKSA
jgi:hypothetical protein